jgi:hypothetical protein
MDDKTRPDETGYRFIGKPMPRKEDARLIVGWLARMAASPM